MPTLDINNVSRKGKPVTTRMPARRARSKRNWHFSFTVDYVDPYAVRMSVTGRARVKAGVSLDRLLNE